MPIALITGATGAIGLAIARLMASEPNAHSVVLVCRDEKKGQAAVKNIISATRNPHVRYELVDVSSYATIRELRKRWSGPLHVLINNAAIAPPRRQESVDGIELQWATNVMSYLWLAEAFRDVLAECAPARIVNVASYWAGDMDLADLEFKRRSYDNDQAYRQSKQANRMLSVIYAEKFAGNKITVNSCHPGDVNSKLSNDLGFGGSETPDQGAATPVWLAKNPIGGEKSGRYFAHCREERCEFAADRQAIQKLYDHCQSITRRLTTSSSSRS